MSEPRADLELSNVSDELRARLRDYFGSRMNDPILGPELIGAALVGAAVEREACARLADRARDTLYGKGWQGEKSRAAANTLALAIRARGGK